MNLYFDSEIAVSDDEIIKVDYNTFRGYEYNKTYEVNPIINSNYELVEVTVDNTENKNADRETDTENDYFVFDDNIFEKWVTVYLDYKSDKYWHGEDAILNEFNAIEVKFEEGEQS